MESIRKLEAELWEAADLLRAGSKLTSNQYCMPVLGLIFLRYAYSRFRMVEREIMKSRPVRNGRALPVEKSDFIAKSALYLPKEAQYAYLLNLPADIKKAHIADRTGREIASLGEAVNNAMELTEEQSPKLAGILPKDYAQFDDSLLSELLKIFNNSALDDVGGDVIGRIYEYFLNKFAKNVASDDGVFFTPKSLVKMIVNVLEPRHGILLDPACGSGGMFVQTGDFVNRQGMSANNAMTFYGQEKVDYNSRLCLMNMAVHGLSVAHIASGDGANTFYNDKHHLAGRCDYVMANPPFNVDKVKAESAQSAGRLPFGLPGVNKKTQEVSNANYLWISYFYAYLNERGRAGFVMASSATDSQGVSGYGARLVVDDVYSTSYTRIAKSGSILFSVRAPVGRLNVTKNKIVIGRGLCAMIHKSGLQSYLFYMLKERFFKDNLIGNGSIFESVSKDDLSKQRFLVAPDKLAEHFNSIAETIDKKILTLDNQRCLAEEARDRLLPKLMDGELEAVL